MGLLSPRRLGRRPDELLHQLIEVHFFGDTNQHRFETPTDSVRQVIGTKPALAIWGTEDRTLQSAHFLPLFRDAFPNGVVHEIERAGHYSPEDQPFLVSHLMRVFLRETDPTPGPAVRQDDRRAIQAVIDAYASAARAGDSRAMKGSFRPDATLHGHLDGELIAGPIQVLFDWVDGHPPAADLDVRIADIDLAGTVATARVELDSWGRYDFTDQFTLLKENGEWRVTSKVFFTRSEGP